ncbi:MAG: hypothetical protein WC506_05640 [Candidatus Micrarchaeia archaeon]
MEDIDILWNNILDLPRSIVPPGVIAIQARFTTKIVTVQIDPDLWTKITQYNQINPEIIVQPDNSNTSMLCLSIPINLYKLIVSISSIQQPEITTDFNRFVISQFWINEILNNNNNLILKKTWNPDHKRRRCESFGIGISIEVVDFLFDINRATLSPMTRKGKGKFPDVSVKTNRQMNAQNLVWEAKGRTRILDKTRMYAQEQKNMNNNAHVRMGILSEFATNSQVNVEVWDPPTEYHDKISKIELDAARAEHYSRIFMMFGQKELSMYFALMKKRITDDITIQEFDTKQYLFHRIQSKYYTEININDQKFFGCLEKIKEDEYVFSGINQKLLSYKGFLEFTNATDDQIIVKKAKRELTNIFILSVDGSCFANLHDLSEISSVNETIVPYYYDTITMKDIDSMNDLDILYIITDAFRKVKFQSMEMKISKHIESSMFDILLNYRDVSYALKFKRRINIKRIQFLNNLAVRLGYNLVIITTHNLSYKNRRAMEQMHVIVIDGDRLKDIIQNNSLILNYLQL